MSDPLLDLDIDALVDDAIRRAEAQPPAERERHATAVEQARLDAARILLERGDSGGRHAAARFLFGMSRSAA